jgi:branched-chain amino acid transport system permease protein
MTTFDLLLQQTINGLSLGAMYALLALGFTLVYGILELINFSHFNVFMVGSFVAMYVLQMFGLSGQDVILTGIPLAGVLLVTFAVTMVFCGGLGVTIERLCLRPLRNVKGPAAMITTIGVSYILFNVILLTAGADSKNFPNPLPSIRYQIGGEDIDVRVILIWISALLLMGRM